MVGSRLWAQLSLALFLGCVAADLLLGCDHVKAEHGKKAMKRIEKGPTATFIKKYAGCYTSHRSIQRNLTRSIMHHNRSSGCEIKFTAEGVCNEPDTLRKYYDCRRSERLKHASAINMTADERYKVDLFTKCVNKAFKELLDAVQ
ncbi:unnamed protein product [Ixodes pacificus]